MAMSARRRNGEVRDAILRVLADGQPRTSRQLAAIVGGSRHNMKQTLQRMARAGMVMRDARLLCLRSEPRERLYALPEFDDRLPADDVSWFDPVQPPPLRKRNPPGQLTRRPRGSIRSAVVALLADGQARTASQVASAIGITRTHARTALRRAAEAGVIARDRRERRMGREERLFAALEVEDSLPESDNPWFEDVSRPPPVSVPPVPPVGGSSVHPVPPVGGGSVPTVPPVSGSSGATVPPISGSKRWGEPCRP